MVNTFGKIKSETDYPYEGKRRHILKNMLETGKPP
jgi:hypothetical protein